MGPRYCSLLSHYWWFIKTPHPTLKDLDESLLSLISKTNRFTCGLYSWLQTTSQAFLPQLPGFSYSFPSAFQICVTPSPSQTLSPPPPLNKKAHKKRDKTHLAWFCCHLRSQLFSSLHSMPICEEKKKLSQNLHFLSSPLLPNFLSSVFHDHQNTAIIFSKVTCYLLFFTVFILELCWFPRGWPSPLLHLSLPCFSFDLVTLQFWFTSSFSNQLLNVFPDSLSHPCRWVLSKVPLLGLSSFCLKHFLVGVGNFYINSERQIQKLTRAT